jgi:hypothetical protein
MSGSSILTGIFSCTNRHTLNEEKKNTISYDAEILLGKDEADEDQFINAILHIFVPKEEKEPEEDVYHFVVGKMISIKDDTIVGDAYDIDDYDLQLDAFTVCDQNTFILVILTTPHLDGPNVWLE